MDTRTTRQKIEDLQKRIAKGVPTDNQSRLQSYYHKLKHEGARTHMRRLGMWYSNGAVQRAFEHAWADGGLTDGQIVDEMERWLTERYYPPNHTAGTDRPLRGVTPPKPIKASRAGLPPNPHRLESDSDS